MIFVHAINFVLVLFLWIFIWTLFNKVVTKLNITDNQMITICIIGILIITYIMYILYLLRPFTIYAGYIRLYLCKDIQYLV